MTDKHSLIYPHYHIPFRSIVRLLSALLASRRLSFHQFAQKCVQGIKPPIQVIQSENIPRNGSCLLLVNHYYRPGFQAYWIGLAISAVTPLEITWVMASGWTYPGKFLGRAREACTSILFRRIAQVFGFILMPPMPPRPWEISKRASAVRQVLNYVKTHPHAVIAMAPEGRDPISGNLEMPSPGVGRFIWQLHKMGLTMIPIGLYEENGFVNLQFGHPLKIEEDLSDRRSEEIDLYIRKLVMVSIAKCLPQKMRGEFMY